tara:strand:+ start:26 stop:1654 length:1629 start_codon:yes stop_codon:yes gene_type:complete
MLNIAIPDNMQELTPKITVIGVGGAGGNAVNNMIESNLEGVEFVVANTDGQALANSTAKRKIQLGINITQGLGAGSVPEIGKSAAEESIQDILSELNDSNMVFITAGLGGGTGTGAAPVIAKAAKEKGILTVSVVTKPFDFEGSHRKKIAEDGIQEIQKFSDTLIVIPNQNLFRLANERTGFAEAFGIADNVLHKGVCGVTDLMVKPGMINLDFADIKTVMSQMGKAMMGTGEASGDNRAIEAADTAINNPLLDETSMKGAKAVLINITGGSDMTLFEVDEAANRIRKEIDANANIIFGSALDDSLNGSIRVSLVATGISTNEITENENSEVHNLFENKIEQPSLNKELSNVDFSSSETKYKEHDIIEEEKESYTDELKFNEIHKTIPSVSNYDNDSQNNEDFIQNGEALEIRNLDDESNNLELNLDDNNQEQSKEIFIPEKTIDVSEIDNTENFSAKLNSLNKESEKEEKENSIINRISGFWNKKENTEKTKVLKEPSLESIEKIKDSNKANEQNSSELDILSKEDDKVLEIPAFLRRQVN